MSGAGEAEHDLRALARRVAPSDLEAVIAEAIDQARAEVLRRLKDEFVRVMLERAVSGEAAGHQASDSPADSAGRDPIREEIDALRATLAANEASLQGEAPAAPGARSAERGGDTHSVAPSQGASGYYVYGVTRSDHPGPGSVAAIDPGATVELVREGELAALVSEIDLDLLAPEAAGIEEEEDVSRLQRAIRAHEAVLEAALRGGTVIPMRFGSACADLGEIRTMLAERQAELSSELGRLSGMTQWTVRFSFDRDLARSWIASANEEVRDLERRAATETSGRSYWLRKKIDDILGREADAAARRATDECHRELSSIARDAKVDDPSRFSSASATSVTGTYLLDEHRVDDLLELIHKLEERHAGIGLELRPVGPWPPYDFVSAGPVRQS